MRYIFLTALVVNFLTSKYEKMDQDTIKSQDKEKESEKALTTLTEQMKNTENLTVQLEPTSQKVTDSREAGGDGGGEPEREAGNSQNFTKQNQKDQIDGTMDDIIEKEKEELVKKNTQLQMELLNKDKYWEDKVTTLMEKKTELEKQRDSLKQRLDECKKKKELNKQKLQAVEKEITNNTMQIQKDRLFFKPSFIALDLDTVFFILLIHTCGADLVQSISTLSQHMWSIVVLAELAFSFIPAVYAWYWKRDKADLLRKNTFLQNQLRKMVQERDDTVAALQEQKKELEKQRRRPVEQLDENERKREENKQKLQSVEKKITEREKMFDKPEELLREKENLLQAQWKLDETKKMLEKQILDREKLLEPIEDLLRINRHDV